MIKRLRIAVADDELDMRDYFARILPRLGHDVAFVGENGRQLVDFCRRSSPDLIITDIRMPEMDGIEASLAINSLRPTPVILVSAFHDERSIQRAEDDHIEAYLVKPIKQADLKTAIALSVRHFEARHPAQGAPHVVPTDPRHDELDAFEPHSGDATDHEHHAASEHGVGDERR